MKVLIDRIGLEEFRGLVEEELSKIGPIDPSPYMGIEDLQREIPPVATGSGSNGSIGGQEEFDKWKESNVFKQKQEGYCLVYVKPIRGDLDTEQFKGMAAIIRGFTGGRASATQEQKPKSLLRHKSVPLKKKCCKAFAFKHQCINRRSTAK